MAEVTFADRRKALEEEFFRKQNQRLVERLRLTRQADEAKQSLAEASGIHDDAVLSRLVELGIGAEAVAALALVPLVEVAWADGKIDARERRAVLVGAASTGVDSQGPAFELLEQWLSERPEPHLLEVWCDYVGSLCGSMTPEQRHQLKQEILGRARAVAEAAGGLLGLGSKVSKAEEGVLESLETAFQA
jgi:hypothetical protein